MSNDPQQEGLIKQKPSQDISTGSGSDKQAPSATVATEQFVYERFINAYYKTFLKNIATYIENSDVNTDTDEGKNLKNVDLYPFMFAFVFSKNLKEEIINYFQNTISYTYEAERILSHAWLVMIKDFTGYLIKHNMTINNLNTLTNRINELSGMLSEAFFRISKRVTITKPDINCDADSYQQILETFKEHINKDKQEEDDYELKIHTYYRGIPVELDATVLKVDSSSVTFSIHPYEAVALSKFGMAFISSSFHGTSFKAYTNHVDITERTATFTHFVPHDHQNERRAHIRVEPTSPIKINLIYELNEFTGTLYDLSEIAVSIYFRNINIDRFQLDQPAQLIVSLPHVFEKGSTLINTTCKIMKVYKHTKGDPNAHRIVVKMEDDQHLKSKLVQYISQRQTEILQELKKLSEESA